MRERSVEGEETVGDAAYRTPRNSMFPYIHATLMAAMAEVDNRSWDSE